MRRDCQLDETEWKKKDWKNLVFGVAHEQCSCTDGQQHLDQIQMCQLL